MNKKERELLGGIVSEMISSMESTPEVITYGETLLRTFPTIKDDVTRGKEVELVYNLIELIRANLVHVSTSPSGLSKADKEIHFIPKEADKLYDVLEDMFEQEDYNITDLTGTLNTYRQCDNNRGVLTLISSPLWCSLIRGCDMGEDTKDFYLGKFLHEDYATGAEGER